MFIFFLFLFLVGIIVYGIFKQYKKHHEHWVLAVFAIAMTMWSTIFIEDWKGKQKTTAMTWGVCGFEEDEQDRPTFEGMIINSPIDGSQVTYFAKAIENRRKALVQVFLLYPILISIQLSLSLFRPLHSTL